MKAKTSWKIESINPSFTFFLNKKSYQYSISTSLCNSIHVYCILRLTYIFIALISNWFASVMWINQQINRWCKVCKIKIFFNAHFYFYMFSPIYQFDNNMRFNLFNRSTRFETIWCLDHIRDNKKCFYTLWKLKCFGIASKVKYKMNSEMYVIKRWIQETKCDADAPVLLFD